MLLNIKNLHVSIGGKEILKGLNLGVNEGEIHAKSPKVRSGTRARTS